MRAWMPIVLLAACMPKEPMTPAAYEVAPDPQRSGLVRRGDRPLTLVGTPIEVGDEAPAPELRGEGLDPVRLDLDDGVVRVLLFVPSLDTNTCSVETRTFNGEVSDHGEGVEVIVISRDLPFAQARFCGAAGIDRVRPLSDYVDGSFGKAWGLYIGETGLLARAVAVVDTAGKVTYLQLVENQPDEPDYAAAMAALHELVPAPPPREVEDTAAPEAE